MHHVVWFFEGRVLYFRRSLLVTGTLNLIGKQLKISSGNKCIWKVCGSCLSREPYFPDWRLFVCVGQTGNSIWGQVMTLSIPLAVHSSWASYVLTLRLLQCPNNPKSQYITQEPNTSNWMYPPPPKGTQDTVYISSLMPVLIPELTV
jgi:hypothetical protein